MDQRTVVLFLFYTFRMYGLCSTDMRDSLRCVNDFMFTINCSLSLTPADFISTNHQLSYWLTFSQEYTDSDRSYSCMLVNTSGGVYSCSVTTNTTTAEGSSPQCFVDFDIFQISLCKKQSNGTEPCQPLDNSYRPAAHIIPNAPCCLTASHNSSHHHFTWKNTYEECLFSSFKECLSYQLRLYKRQHKHDVIFHDINADHVYPSVENGKFVADTEYAAQVRSRPSADPFFGDWSDWSSEVRWRTSSDQPGQGLLSKYSKAVLITLCVMATLVLLSCCAPFQKWRQGVFIPTPAPYFQSLYSECQGDFRSWVEGQSNMTAVLKPQDMLQADSMRSTQERTPQHHHLACEGSIYQNTGDIVCDSAPVGIPVKPATNTSLRPTEDKSACRPSSVPPIQDGPSWYSPEYCTMSAFQQLQPTTRNAQILV
ncbi:interleukin-21 receptor [Dunckerocampus dactyliophorus]|uniref:interleukin-21 receptor n=1 Tax=Dunckerocampus dactyliophorus TaxID=161453 RepID=UPI002405C756|nr:interleukin-21 receptor [Dunckerocampus dactyliophorus]